MRRLTTIAAAAVAVLALAGVAVAKFNQTASITLTAKHGGQSTGIKSSIRATDATAPASKPKSVKTLAIGFPVGTSFNLSTPLVTRCTLTDTQLRTPFGPTCPSSSKIGTGTAELNMAPVGPPFTTTATATAYVAGASQVIVELLPKLPPGVPPIIIRGNVIGSRLTLHVPQTWLGRSSKYKFAGVKMVLTSLRLNVPALGSGADALITSGKCTSGRFVVTERFTYANQSTKTLKSSSACS